MYTAEIQSLIVRFWGEFSVSPLYDTGYGEPVATGGLLHLSQTRDDLLRGLAYMKGYADACRLACPYKSRGWEIAQIVGLAASVLYTTVSASGETTAEHVTSLCDRYRRELIALLEKEDDASTYRLGLALASPIGGTR